MAFRFQTFRRILSIIIAIMAAVSVSLGFALFKLFLRPGTAWLLISVEIVCMIRSLWSVLRKPVFGTPQSVASEVVGLFVLFPFQLIIALVISTAAPKQNIVNPEAITFKIFAVTSACLHLAYTLGLILLAIVTVPAFDADVWMRDIDSSPSPFPLAIIFAFMFPRIARGIPSLRSLVPLPTSQEPVQATCLSTCASNCREHGQRDNDKMGSSCPGRIVTSELATRREETKRVPPTLPHTLIRIPNAAEQRASIYLELPVGIL